MTTNQPPRKRSLIEVLNDVENDVLTAEQAQAELEAPEQDDTES